MNPSKLRRRTVLVSTTALLAACGTIPQPFRGTAKVTSDNPLLDMPTAVGIAVLPAENLPSPLAMRLAAAVAEQLQAADIPAEAVEKRGGLGFALTARAAEPAVGAEARRVEITWTLQSKHGATAAHFTQTAQLSNDDWQGAEDKSLSVTGRDAARAAARAVVAAIEGPDLPEAPPPAAAKRALPTVSVLPVEGAPGDGREALKLAVLQTLTDNGVRRDDVNPAVKLEGKVEIKPYDISTQHVVISWRALLRDGRDLGTVKIENTVPNGALDGSWGATAFAIAAAAARDLLNLLAATPDS